MNVGFAVDSQPLVVRQLLAPGFAAEGFLGPVVVIEPPPENRTAVFVQILLAGYAVIKTLDVHDADRVVALAANGDFRAAHHIHHLFGRLACEA